MSNVGYTPGSGKTVATDTISAVEYQRIKIGIGSTGKFKELQPVTNGFSAASTAAATIASSSGILLGINVFSTASVTGSFIVQIRDSTSSSTGNIIWGICQSTGAGAVRQGGLWFGDVGVKFTSGLRIQRIGVAKTTVNLYYLSPA